MRCTMDKEFMKAMKELDEAAAEVGGFVEPIRYNSPEEEAREKRRLEEFFRQLRNKKTE